MQLGSLDKNLILNPVRYSCAALCIEIGKLKFYIYVTPAARYLHEYVNL